MSKSHRALSAQTDHDSGFNCAQSVLMQFSGTLGLSREQAAKLASGFGGGMRMGRTCGALTGALMALGLAYGFSEAAPALKQEMETMTQRFTEEFQALNGSTECKDILGLDISDPKTRQQARENGVFAAKCPPAIDSAVLLLERYLEIGDPTRL